MTVAGSRSVVSYTPKSEMDFGSLACWASNSVGSAALPCVYLLVPIGPPDPPSRCSASNVTYSTVKVQSRNCEEQEKEGGEVEEGEYGEHLGGELAAGKLHTKMIMGSLK